MTLRCDFQRIERLEACPKNERKVKEKAKEKEIKRTQNPSTAHQHSSALISSAQLEVETGRLRPRRK
jgi:hypothetical protein